MIIGICPECGSPIRVGTDMTNADRIRAMTDEELAKTLNVSICPPGYNEIWACEKEEELCHDCWLEWLQVESGEA